MATIQNRGPVDVGALHEPSKLDQFVKSTKDFFGRALTWVRSIGQREAEHVQNAVLPEVEVQHEFPQESVTKALPSSRVAFDALATLGLTVIPRTVQSCRDGLASVKTAAELLTGDIPMGGQEWTDTCQSLQNNLHELRQHEETLRDLSERNPFNRGLQDVHTAVNDAMLQVESRLTYLQNFEGSHALAQSKVADAKAGWVEAALMVIDDKITELENADPPKNVDALLRLKVEISNTAIEDLNNADPKVVVEDGGNLKTASKDLAEKIKTALRECGVTEKTGDLAKEVHGKHVDVLNSRDWPKLDKQIQFVKDGVPHTFTSHIHSATHISTLEKSYNGKGICCQSRAEKDHAVNLCSTELKDDAGNTVFKGVRSGIIGAYGIRDPEERQQANLNRADELLLGVVGSRHDLEHLAMNYQEGDAPIEFDMTSINLLTPDTGRWLFSGKDSGSTDRAITNDQLRTLQQIDGTVRELTFTDKNGIERTIKVKPNIAAFSFGVNEGATRDGVKAGLMYYAPGGGKGSFDNVRNANALAMNKLIGDPTVGLDDIDPNSQIGKFLADPTKSEADKQIVRELREQIRDMWNNDGYMVHEGDPHKMVARIAVLTHVMGGTPCFNCKSGKDRTGTLDVEAKFLASRIEFNKRAAIAQNIDPTTISLVPRPGALTTDEKAIYRQFAISSGNLEVQEYNTGIGGYKTGAQKALQARLGDDEAIRRFKGGSKHVDA